MSGSSTSCWVENEARYLVFWNERVEMVWNILIGIREKIIVFWIFNFANHVSYRLKIRETGSARWKWLEKFERDSFPRAAIKRKDREIGMMERRNIRYTVECGRSYFLSRGRYHGRVEAGTGQGRSQGLLAPSRTMFGLPRPNRRDHKSYDRQGTTHSRHFASRPI